MNALLAVKAHHARDACGLLQFCHILVTRVRSVDRTQTVRARGRMIRFGAGALVAFISLVVLVVVLIDGSKTKVGTPTVSSTRETRGGRPTR